MTIFTMSRSSLLPKAVVLVERAPTHLLRGHFGAWQLVHHGGPTKAILLRICLPFETILLHGMGLSSVRHYPIFIVVAPKIDSAESALVISKPRSESDNDSPTPHRLWKFDIYKLYRERKMCDVVKL